MIRDKALGFARYGRAPVRWDTDFGRWVHDFGVSRIVSALAQDPSLRVTNRSAYERLQGHALRPPRAASVPAAEPVAGNRPHRRKLWKRVGHRGMIVSRPAIAPCATAKVLRRL